MTTAAYEDQRSEVPGLTPSMLTWLAVGALALASAWLSYTQPWLVTYPKEWIFPFVTGFNAVMDVVLPVVKPVFRFVSDMLSYPMRAIKDALIWLPWPVAMVLFTAIAYRSSGPRLALFALGTLAYIYVAGYWRESMNTLALVLLAVPLSVGIGFLIGVYGYKRPRVRNTINATMDLMQTMPSFAYLIPLLLLFGFGPVVGLIASAIYAAPPMVRNTMLGLELVPQSIKEASTMSGSTGRQRFWLAELPSARGHLLVGLNQTSNYALSMVIVAAIIGGFEDVGWEVLSSMRKAAFGQSLASGVVIALIAILIDRIMLGFALKQQQGAAAAKGHLDGSRLLILIGVGLAAGFLIHAFSLDWAYAVPGSEARVVFAKLDEVLLGFVKDYAGVFNAIKNAAFYCLMLPLRIGIKGCATPAVWGIMLTPALIAAYAGGVLALAALVGARWSWRAAIGIVTLGLILFFGFGGLPWPILIAVLGLAAYEAGGKRVAAITVGGLLFILTSGHWGFFMQSAYLCALAVLLCLLIGGGLGIWAAENDRVSKLLRPINDALQTMPQFVFLIPALMLFKVGDFTALIAVMLYAIVPPIRYVEHGLRTVPAHIVEAARQMGASQRQLLWQVKMPLALPVVVLGINQTIMAALSMLTIAALVGTRDLGQQVYVALSNADAGKGLAAGFSIALIATMSDRILQAVANKSPAARSQPSH
jgi:glycine betaine/proline transport system permease protein